MAEARPESDEADSGRIIVPLLEESLHVDKRWVDRGGYRLTKHVELREEIVDHDLQSGQVTVERHPFGTLLPAGTHPITRQEGNVTIYPVLKEVIVTEKRLVLVEEIHVTQSATRDRHPQTVTLRREDIRIERLEAGDPPAPTPT